MSREDRIAAVISAWRVRREAGESVDPEEVIAEHPDLAEDLRTHFAAVQLLDFAILDRMDADQGPAALDREGARIGPYEVLRLIGEGGMGRVYLAEQQEPIQRRVALKVLDGRVDNPKRRARFEVEREALALMDHPFIAPVYDAGVAADGTPYVAMAYVEGETITAHCTGEALGLRRRLKLFTQVCEAVHHAHQKGVIHRDIKPSNVLVAGTNGQSSPRVIDFGLAKPFDTDLELESQLTVDDQILGTPAYMSPEQASGARDVDVRTDVYALGVLLYEMLTDDVPWGRATFTRRNLAASLKRILEEEPPKPSTHASTVRRRVTTDGERDRTPTPFSGRSLKGDLDWIVMKALAKERDRRYASAQDLAEDVGRHLRNEPVKAGPPTLSYRLRKFVRRHRLAVGFAACLILAAIVSGYLLSRVREEADRRRAEETSVQALLDSLLMDLDAPRADTGPLASRQAVASRIYEHYRDQDPSLLPAQDLRRMGQALAEVGRALIARGDRTTGLAALERVEEILAPRIAPGVRDPAALFIVGSALTARSRNLDARAAREPILQAGEYARRLAAIEPGSTSSRALRAMHLIAHGTADARSVKYGPSEYARVRVLLDEAGVLIDQVVREEPEEWRWWALKLDQRSGIGYALYLAGHRKASMDVTDDIAPVLTEALRRFPRQFHLLGRAAQTAFNRSATRVDLGWPEPALDWTEQAIEWNQQILTIEPDSRRAQKWLPWCHLIRHIAFTQLGRFDDARREIERVDSYRKQWNVDLEETPYWIGELELLVGQPGIAREQFELGERLWIKLRTSEDPSAEECHDHDLAKAHLAVGRALLELGDLEAAEAKVRRSLETHATSAAWHALGRVLAANGSTPEALEALGRGHALAAGSIEANPYNEKHRLGLLRLQRDQARVLLDLPVESRRGIDVEEVLEAALEVLTRYASEGRFPHETRELTAVFRELLAEARGS